MKPVKFSEKGFTLIELLIVVLIVGLLYSTIHPFGQRLYSRFEAMRKLEEIRTFLLEQKREAFLYGKRIELYVQEGRLITQDNKTFSSNDVFFSSPNPIIFYPLGTTNGGNLTIIYKDFTFEIEITPPTGDIQVRS